MTVTSLPAPTPTELAAIRARLQRRSWPNRQVRGSGALLLLPLSLFVAGLGLVLVSVFREVGSTAMGFALSLLHVGVAGLWLLDDAAARATDRAVAERLSADGVQPSDRRDVRPFARLGAGGATATALLALSQLGTTALVAMRVSPGMLAVVAGIGPFLLLATHLLLLRRGLIGAGVTGTAVLDTVDDAVLRSDVATRVRSWAPFGISAVALLSTLPDTAGARPVAWVSFVTGIAAVGCAELVRRRDRPLLEEPRLADVTPAGSWLAGSPATVSPPPGGPAT